MLNYPKVRFLLVTLTYTYFKSMAQITYIKIEAQLDELDHCAKAWLEYIQSLDTSKLIDTCCNGNGVYVY